MARVPRLMTASSVREKWWGVASAWMQSTLFSDSARSYQDIQGIQPTPSAEVTPEPTPEGDTLYFNLAAGSSGNAVQQLQTRLQSLGYAVTPTGQYDEATRLAVSDFQTAIGVPATGEASASMQRYVYSYAAPGPDVRFYNVPQSFNELQPGDTGDAVSRLQQQLFSLNLLKRQDVQGSVGTAPEKPLSLLADVVMLVSALAHSIIDRAREISCCIQDRSVHIKNHCFILHIYPFRDVDDLS